MKKRIIPLVILIAAVAAFLWMRRSTAAGDPVVRFSGNLELTEVRIAFKTPGKLVELLVDEGAAVKKGQLIARLDKESLLRQREREAAAVEMAASQVAQLETAIEWQRQTVESDTALRRADIRAAKAHLAALVAGSRAQEIEQAQAAAEDIRTQHEQARLDWERAQKLFARDDISAAQHDRSRTRFLSTAAAARQAGERLALVREGPRQEDIEAGRAQVARAEAALLVSEATRIEIRRREQELVARRADVERARAQLRVIETQIADTEVYSPIDGVVLVKSADPGEVLAAGTTVVTIGDLDRPWLRGYITERQLGRVKLGDKAKLSTDSYPGKAYAGVVSFISAEAEFTPKQIQTAEERVKLVYRIKVDVENRHRELKSNMPVDAEIQLSEK